MEKEIPPIELTFWYYGIKCPTARIPQPIGWEAYMRKCITSDKSTQTVIDAVEPTNESLSSRSGLTIFVCYLKGIQIGVMLERLFGSLCKTRKGQPVREIFKQRFCFLVDGTSPRLVYFDQSREDAAIENKPDGCSPRTRSNAFSARSGAEDLSVSPYFAEAFPLETEFCKTRDDGWQRCNGDKQ
jgi:hypothetical protein